MFTKFPPQPAKDQQSSEVTYEDLEQPMCLYNPRIRNTKPMQRVTKMLPHWKHRLSKKQGYENAVYVTPLQKTTLSMDMFNVD